jgi:hypothetical protein
MRNNMIVRGIIPLLAILVLMIMAYGFSFQVSNLFDQRMRRDIQVFTRQLTQAGVPQAQIKVSRSVLLDMNRDTLSYVTSEVFNIVGAFSFMGIIIMTFCLTLAGSIAAQKKEEN